MRQFLTFLLLALLLPVGSALSGPTFPPENHSIFAPRFCQIYGAIYLERNPARQAGTQFTVYEEPEEAFANLVVYKESNKLFADQQGLWYITSNRDFANFVLFVSPNRNLADFSVHFTEVRSFAGCKD